MPALRTLALAVLLCATALVSACGDDDSSAAGDASLTVVATTTQAADLARAVGGDRARVVGLLPANADPHDYEVRPDDVKELTDAGLVIRSGGDLDDWLKSAIESSGTDAPELTLIDHVQTREGGHGHEEEEHAAEEEEHAAEEEEEHAEGEEEHAAEGEEEHEIDPHWWQDPHNAEAAVAEIEKALSAADADGAATYARNADAYTAKLKALDTAVAKCIDQIPPAQRKLVTTHDALGYYAERYGLEVVGAVIPALTTQAQASAGEVDELIETIRHERVKAIFAESSINPKLEQVIADESGAQVGKALWADTLGPQGSDGDTYLKSIASNTRAIADGLSGGAVSCTLPD
jgi:zinc/manganese transport system substrate-binding protein